REIANRRAGIEERDRSTGEVAGKIEPVREIGQNPLHLDVRVRDGTALYSGHERVGRDVDADITPRRDERQPLRGLRAVARAEVDELAAGADRAGDLVAIT